MRLSPMFLVVSLIALVVTQVSSRASYRDEEARAFVSETSEKAKRMLNAMRDLTFPSDYGFFENIANLAIFFQIIEEVVKDAQTARNFSPGTIHDPQLKKALDNLGDPGLLVLGDDYISKLLTALSTLDELATQEDICSYHQKSYCELSYLPDVRRVVSQSHDPHELQYYWEEWRKKNNNWAKTNMEAFVSLYKNASILVGKSPLDMWFNTYDDPNFLEDMEDVMKQLKPFYTEFHAYVRNVLNTKYGELIVTAHGPIPHHLVEQILVQAWKKNSLLDQPYPEKRLPNLKEQLDQHGLNARRIVEVADEFFRSLGFSELPQEFWDSRIKPKTKEEAGQDCKAEVFDSTPDVSLKYCPKANFKKFLQIHGDVARLHYANQKKDLPFAFFDSYEFEYAVGEAAILSASTPKHITRIGLLRNYFYDEQLSMNRLFRLGLHTMFNIPMHFVHAKVMAEVLSDRVPFENINKRYWELMEEYAGIEPPSDRNSHEFDFPYKFYLDIDDNHQTRKFVNEILGYQIYRALCKKSGDYVKGNRNKPLQNCDFYGSHEAGNALKRFMSLGSTKSWKETLAVLIEDEPDLNAAALLEFYEPLRHWIEGQNRVNNVQTGWEHSKHRVL